MYYQKIMVKYQRTLNTLITLFLIFCIFINGVMADFCLCGKACPHALQDKRANKANLPFHYRCCGSCCKSCNIETGQTLKSANTIVTTYHVNIFDIDTVISFLVDHPSIIQSIKYFALFNACEKISDSHIFHQNLPLRC